MEQQDPSTIINDANKVAMIRFALGRVNNGAGVLTQPDVDQASGSTTIDAAGAMLNQLQGKGNMSREQLRRSLALIKQIESTERASIQAQVDRYRREASLAGVPAQMMGLVTPGFDAEMPRQPGGGGAPPPAAVQMLIANPGTASYFDETFGTPADPNPSRRLLASRPRNGATGTPAQSPGRVEVRPSRVRPENSLPLRGQ